MANINIVITNQAGVDTDVSYIQEIPISLNFLIADIRNPDKRNTTFSKTIQLPGTKEVNILFSNIFQLNNSLTTFDPRLKCKIKYYVNSRLQLNGEMKLLSIDRDLQNSEKIYSIAITGTLGNLMIAIGSKLITGNVSSSDDIDMSAYDIALTKANVVASWSATVGTGVLFGLVNRGLNNISSDTEYHIKHFRPSIYKLDLWNKIFSDAGYTFTSTHLNTNYYKRQLIDSIGETFNISTSDRANAEFFASRNSTQTGTGYPSTHIAAGVWSSLNTATDVVLFNEDTTAPYNDAGGVYNTGNGEFTVPVTRKYKLVTELNGVGYTITNSSFVVTSVVWTTCVVAVNITKFVGASWVTVATNTVDFTTNGGGVTSCVNQGVLTAGDIYRVEVLPSYLVFAPKHGAGLSITIGTTTVTQTFGGVVYNPSFPSTLQTSRYFAVVDDLTITEGDLVEMNQALPINTKQIDWIMTEVKANNLYIEVDPSNEFNYIIEPRDDGFYNGYDEWTDLLDWSKRVEQYPVLELNNKRYEFTYKPDSDYYNETYQKEFQQPYGYGYTDTISDFASGVQKTELLYAPTPMVGNGSCGLVVPTIYKIDAGVLKPMKSAMRSWYYGGVINIAWGSWKLKSTLSGDTIYYTYPFVGNCDNPYNPTLSLDWDVPHKVFYNYQQATYTTNNLKNRFYSKMINELSDKRSTVIKAWFNLDEIKIKNFSFRNKIRIGHPFNAEFIVTSINNYNIYDRESTQVELLKVAEYAVWAGGNSIVPPDPINTEIFRVQNGNLLLGDAGQIYGNNSFITGGSGNYIAQGAESISLTNCTNVIVQSDVIGFTGIGLSNVVITSANSNTTLNGADNSITITSDTTLDISYNNKVIYVDATTGNVTITWDSSTMINCRVYLIRADGSANLVYINDSDATAQFIGNAVPVDLQMLQYDAIPLTQKIDSGGTKQIYILA